MLQTAFNGVVTGIIMTLPALAVTLLDADADPDGDTFDTISEDELLRGIESLAPPERRDD